MADNNSYKQTPRHRGPGRGMMPAEKAKDFKGSIGKLIKYVGSYRTKGTWKGNNRSFRRPYEENSRHRWY